MVALPFCRFTLNAAKPKDALYPKELNTLSDHLRTRRLDLGLTQQQVGKLVGVTACTIQYWETNRFKPAVRFIPRIIEFLGHDPTCEVEPQSLGDRIKFKRLRLGLSIKHCQ
jgi:DNA-binding XRE family transcriptional regulator